MNNLRKDDYCHICKEPLKDYPSNGEPLVHGVVCKACNFKLVLPIRWLMRVHHALVNSLPLYYESYEDILRPVLSIPEIKKFTRQNIEACFGGDEVALDVDIVPPFVYYPSYMIACREDDWQFFMGAEHVFDLMTMDYEERCFTEYLGEILERMHGLKKEHRMDFMIIPRWLLEDSIHVDYDRMLDDVKKELKENRKALRLPCQRD